MWRDDPKSGGGRGSRAGAWPPSPAMGRMDGARGSSPSRDPAKEPKGRRTQPVTAARGRGRAAGAIGRSLAGGPGHSQREEQNHRPKRAAFCGLTQARDRLFPFLSPVNIPSCINRASAKSLPQTATPTPLATCSPSGIKTQPLF